MVSHVTLPIMYWGPVLLRATSLTCLGVPSWDTSKLHVPQ